MAAGAHFGHKKERSHPKAKPYVYTLREGIYIIDLAKTQQGLEDALNFISQLVKEGMTILFVGTKPQAIESIEEAAKTTAMPYIVSRWPGGLLTNFETVQQNLKQLNTMETKLASDEYASLTKKEKRIMAEKIRKANETLGGVREMTKLPDALFVVDAMAEATAIQEAYRLGIPIVAICDTNANPSLIDYPIPANDDAKRTIELIVAKVSEAITVSKGKMAPIEVATDVKQEVKAENQESRIENRES